MDDYRAIMQLEIAIPNKSGSILGPTIELYPLVGMGLFFASTQPQISHAKSIMQGIF
jgi:hypothetical protein